MKIIPKKHNAAHESRAKAKPPWLGFSESTPMKTCSRRRYKRLHVDDDVDVGSENRLRCKCTRANTQLCPTMRRHFLSRKRVLDPTRKYTAYVTLDESKIRPYEIFCFRRQRININLYPVGRVLHPLEGMRRLHCTGAGSYGSSIP